MNTLRHVLLHLDGSFHSTFCAIGNYPEYPDTRNTFRVLHLPATKRNDMVIKFGGHQSQYVIVTPYFVFFLMSPTLRFSVCFAKGFQWVLFALVVYPEIAPR